MTISAPTVKTVVAGAGAIISAQAIPAVFYDNSHVQVWVVSYSDGVPTETRLTETDDYTITKSQVAGSRPAAYSGSVSTIDAVATGSNLVILVYPPNSQTSSIAAGGYNPAELERLHDAAAVRDQSLLDRLAGVLRMAMDWQGSAPLVAPGTADTVLAWDSDAEKIVPGPSITDIAAANTAVTEAEAAAGDAQDAADAAADSAAAAAASAGTASSQATAAAASASAADTSATSASSSASSAASAATAAANSATTAGTNASAASASASAASSSATSASASATTASSAATTATTQATAAAASASAAAASATGAASSATASATAQAAAEAAQAAAETAETNAAASATAAASSATAASGSATAAASSATAAATSETNAGNSATAAAASASAAATSETNAASSASAAASARDATLAAFDSFDDRYLGAKSSDPTLDNDGDPLAAGMLYYNTSTEVMKVYTGSSWVAAYVSGSDFVPLAGGTMTGALTLSGDPTADLHAATKQYVDTGLAGKAATSHTHDDRYYTETETDTLLAGKSDTGHTHTFASLTSKPTTLAGFGITDAYTQTEIDTALSGKSDTSHTHAFADLTSKPTTIAGYGITDAYTDSEVDTLLAGKSDTGHVHTFASLTSKPTTLSGYGITDAQGLNSNLTAFAGLSGAADKLPYFTAAATLALADLTAFARTLLDDANAAAVLSTLGLSNVLFKDVENQAITGGGEVTSKALGTKTSGTTTIDVADRMLQDMTMNGSITLTIGTPKGATMVDIVMGASATLITESGIDYSTGDPWTYTSGHKFRCHMSNGANGKMLIRQKMQ